MDDIEQGMPQDFVLEDDALNVEPASNYGLLAGLAAVLVPGGIIGM